MTSMNLPANALLCSYLTPAVECSLRKWWNGCLHANFDSFEWTKSNVGDEFGRGTGSEIETRFIFVCVLLPSQIGVRFLEELVSTVFKSTLSLEMRLENIKASL
jgi:hypothetical protein